MADAPPTAAFAVTDTAQPEVAPVVLAQMEVPSAEPESAEPHEALADVEVLPTLEAVPDGPAEIREEVSAPSLEAAPAAVEPVHTPAESEIALPEFTASIAEEVVVSEASPVLPMEQTHANAEVQAVAEALPPAEIEIRPVAETNSAPVSRTPAEPPRPAPPRDILGAKIVLKDLIRKHSVKAIAIGSNSTSRNLENLLRQILAEEAIEGIFIAAVNDAGIAIYASSRIAREELPELNVSTRCAVSLARRLQDPLGELVKVDPKLIGVGQYQHDVDQKELHRGLLQTVRSCVNNVGADPNTAGPSLLRYIAGFNDKMARKVLAARNSTGQFRTRAALLSVPGMDQGTFEQSAGFLRIRDAQNPIDRSAIHLESYPIVEKMAQSLGVGVPELFGNRDLVSRLRLEDFVTERAGLPTLKDIREELLRPGRDPRRTFATPKFRPDVKDIGDLKEGMTLEGTVTNVTNFGAFVDIGVRQDGLVHLSQMSNRFIRDPREAVKVGDVVNVKVISVEPETKRIGLSIKALLPALPRRRKKVLRRPPRPTEPTPAQTPPPAGDGAATEAPTLQAAPTNRSGPPIAAQRPEYRRRDRDRRPEGSRRSPRPRGDRREHRPTKAEPVPVAVAPDPLPPEPEEPKGPEPTLQEKIALLQSKFKGIS
jgi:predicted RNA-binding protein with RPS1 domain